jgi:hypothetical protein
VARSTSRAGRIRLNCTLFCCTATSCASACTLYSSARSNGLAAMLCATSHVSARLIGHSSSSGVSIQSRISPNSERCSRWNSFIRGDEPPLAANAPSGGSADA